MLRFLSFTTYRIVEKRARWIAAVRREKWILGIGARICNEHFVLGKLRMIIIRLLNYIEVPCTLIVRSVFPTAHKLTGNSFSSDIARLQERKKKKRTKRLSELQKRL